MNSYPLFYQCQSISQHSVGGCFSAEGIPHDHETMSYYHHLEYLLDFLEKYRRALDIRFVTRFFSARIQVCVVWFG